MLQTIQKGSKLLKITPMKLLKITQNIKNVSKLLKMSTNHSKTLKYSKLLKIASNYFNFSNFLRTDLTHSKLLKITQPIQKFQKKA